MSDETAGSFLPVQAKLEALLFTAHDPVPLQELATNLDLPVGAVAQQLAELDKHYQQTGHGLRLREVAGGWQLVTSPELAGVVQRFLEPDPLELTQASLEVLALVAVKQPVTRAEVEAVRGVNCASSLRLLVDHDLVQEAGRLEAPGRPYLYETTDRFLDVFGLPGLETVQEVAASLDTGTDE